MAGSIMSTISVARSRKTCAEQGMHLVHVFGWEPMTPAQRGTDALVNDSMSPNEGRHCRQTPEALTAKGRPAHLVTGQIVSGQQAAHHPDVRLEQADFLRHGPMTIGP